MIKTCLVGGGRMGHIRLQTLTNDPHVEVITMVTKLSGIKLAETHGIPHVPSLDDLDVATWEALDAFILTNRTSDHAPIIEFICDMAKKDEKYYFIFCEKPISDCPEKIKHVFDKCEKSGVTLCCGFQRRFDESYVALRNAIKSGAIGQPTFGRVFFADHPVPSLDFLLEGGGDIFVDLTPHDLDFVRWCLDDQLVSVSAMGSSTHPELAKNNVLDTIVLNLKFSRGCMVNMFCSRSCAYGYDQRCEFFGPEGSAEINNQPKDLLKISNDKGQTTSTLKYSFPERFEQAFKTELETFFKVCRGQATWPVTKEDCHEVQRMALLASRACKEGNVVDAHKRRLSVDEFED